MKTKLITLFIFQLALSNLYAQNQSNLVRIEINTPPGAYDSVSYYLSKNSFTAYGLWGYKHSRLDSSGNVNLELPSNEINYLLVLFNSEREDTETILKDRVSLLIRPGESYNITYNAENPLWFDIKGKFGEFQKQCTQYFYNEGIWKDRADTIPERILENLNDSIEQALKPFEKLYSNNQIDKEQYLYTKGLIEYNYVYSLIKSLSDRNFTPRIIKNLSNAKYAKEVERLGIVYIDAKLEKWETLVSKLIEKYPYDYPYNRFMPHYNRYCLDSYLWFKTLNDSSLSNAFQQGKRKQIEIAKQFLNDSLYEYYFASQFGGFPLQTSIDSIKALLDDFEQEFPNSIYLNGVKKHYNFFTEFFGGYYPIKASALIIEKQGEIYIEKPLFPEVAFIEDNDSITSLDSLFAKFNGKPIFVDIWASWCMPCRSEFQFSDTVYDFLSKNGYEMLYISTDKNETKWLSIVEHYALKGAHFRASNKKIKKEIGTITPFVPTYLIVNKNGVIINDDAKRPHETEELFKQLLEAKENDSTINNINKSDDLN